VGEDVEHIAGRDRTVVGQRSVTRAAGHQDLAARFDEATRALVDAKDAITPR